MHWSNAYVGVPYKDKGRSLEGVDCWGVPYLVLRELAGVEVPSYTESYAGAAEVREVSALFGQLNSWPWRPVELGQEREFDVAFFRTGNCASHCGIVVKPGWMLHVLDGYHARVEEFTGGRWSLRLLGIARHVDLA